MNPQAYLLYLRGNVLQDSLVPADNQAAIEALQRAVSTDPNFAPAYAALGHAYTERLFFLDPKQVWDQKAGTAIEKALALDPDLPQAHLSRATLLFTPAHGWQFEKAIQECRRAVTLNPSLADGHVLLGIVYLHVGLIEESLREFQTAGALSPSQPDVAWYTSLALVSGGRFQDAVPLLRAVSVAPALKTYLAYDLWQAGRKQEAKTLVGELLKDDPQEKNVWLATVHTLLLADPDNRRQVEERITGKILKQAEALKPYGHFHHIANFVADIYAQLREPKQAVAWLQQTAATGFPCYPFFERDPALDPIRQDPRFIAFMQKLKPEWQHFESTYGSGALARNSRNP